MRGREFNKRIELWQTAPSSDGFGGSITNPIDVLISNSFAKIRTTTPGDNLSNFGIIDSQKTILITVRFREDVTYNIETMYIKYRNKKYTINTAPINENFDDAFITFAATEETAKSNTAG